MGPLAGQARLQIAQLRDLNLKLARQGACALGEDVQDQLASVDNPKVELFFEIARLGRTETVVKNRERRALLARYRPQLADLALADKGTRVDFLEVLPDLAADLGARTLRQRGQFGERVFAGDLALAAKLDSDQNRSFGPFDRLAIRPQN
jgi:hypothetical protein